MNFMLRQNVLPGNIFTPKLYNQMNLSLINFTEYIVLEYSIIPAPQFFCISNSISRDLTFFLNALKNCKNINTKASRMGKVVNKMAFNIKCEKVKNVTNEDITRIKAKEEEIVAAEKELKIKIERDIIIESNLRSLLDK